MKEQTPKPPCLSCNGAIPAYRRSNARYCSARCRNTLQCRTWRRKRNLANWRREEIPRMTGDTRTEPLYIWVKRTPSSGEDDDNQLSSPPAVGKAP